jgi:hypothetical protein
LLAEIELLRALLQKLRWKSIDKDNMEYSCRIPTTSWTRFAAPWSQSHD